MYTAQELRNRQQRERREFLAHRNRRTYPTKKALRNSMWQWTFGTANHETPVYQVVQSTKREGNNVKDPYRRWRYHRFADAVDKGVHAYMQRLALRAPTLPTKARNANTGSDIRTLYRGMLLDQEEVQSLLRDGVVRDAGYMAFTWDLKVAVEFASNPPSLQQWTPGELYELLPNTKPVVLRLHLKDVPGGTPWVWFAQKGRAPNKTWVETNTGAEKEVLLPPGVLHVTKVNKTTTRRQLPGYAWNSDAYLLDVTYRPVSERTPFVVLKAVTKFKKLAKKKKT